ncbi:probable polygalacturonase At3g15720 [Cicer arietinum]|uniref:Probable polygalacturonase At3g15720 n=1 Tax=Cicer arietinum TaxID=3827 RepID=A0A1S2YUU4_CICAR|nr:probable polygalacturonase At3g15720 [Cicer arietinum]
MQVLITLVLVLGFVSPSLCTRWNVVEANNNNNTYNVMQYGASGDGKSDDSQAFLMAWNSTCGVQGEATLVIPPKLSFLVNNLIFTGDCKATSITIQVVMIQYINNLTIDGHNTGKIDGYGSTWWECKSCPRPRAISIHSCNDLIFTNLRVTDSPGGHISINGCKNATFSHLFVDAPGTSPNTDGFDISASQNILIKNSVVSTGDDCVAVNGGSSYINVTRIVCGPGHGISIGSLGKGESYETVEEVHVYNCTFANTTNGARIKTFPGGSGYARNITFEQINLINVTYPIIIDQHYGVKDATESAVLVSDVTYRGFSGTAFRDIAIKLLCSSLGCSNIVLDDINIVSSQIGKRVGAFCQNLNGTIESTVPKVSC